MEIATTRRRSGRAVRILVDLLFAAVILLAVSFIAPAAFGLQRYVITGSSMAGTMDVGSVAFAEVVPVGDLEVGDVITYRPPAESDIGHLVTHRIVSIKGDAYRTQGDANADVDPWTFELSSGAQARVTYAVPYVGFVFIALQDRNTRMVLIGIPAGLVALASLGQLVGALRNRTLTGRRSTTVSVGG